MFGIPSRADAAIAVTAADLTYGTQSNVASVTVPGSATISARVTGAVTNGGLSNWRSTTYQIGGALIACINHANFNSPGTYTPTFNILAPAAAGTYDVVFTPYAGNTCGGTAGTAFTLPGGVVVDNSAPTVSSINRVGASPTNATSVSWTVTFNESVTGVAAGDFSLAQTGVSGASITSITGGGTTWTVTANTGSGDGTVGLNLVDDDSILNLAGLPLGGAGAGNGDFTGQVYTIDKTSPMASIACVVACGAANPTSAATVQWTVTFSEVVTGVAPNNFTLSGTGTSGASIGSVGGSGTTYTVTAATGVDGTLGLNLSANLGNIIDVAGNSPASVSAVAANTYTVSRVSNFNAFETTTAANAIVGSIHTKIAGVGFSLDVVAINSSNAQSSGFNNNVRLELLANAGTPGSGYGADNCPTSNSVLQTVASAAIAGGRSIVSFSAVANVYRDVRVRISYPTASPTIVVCAGDSFAIRPNTLGFLVQHANRTTEGTAATLNNTAIPGGTVHNAGRPFRITATAYNGAATPATTSNYDGTPTVEALGVCVGTACTPSLGALSLGTWSASAGTVTTTTASYTEVGAFSLQLIDDTFAVIDDGDGSTIAQRRVSSTATGVGRFVPDHFNTTVTQGCSGSFTYSGQPFEVTVTAYNSANNPTLNFGGAFATDVTLSNVGTLNPGSFTAGATFAAASFAIGVQQRTDVTYTFTAKETAPLSGPDVLTVRATDADGGDSSGGSQGTAAIRSGRLQIQNAFGSELVDLSMPTRVQHYTTNGWATNTTDNCTVVTLSAFANPQGNLVANETCVQDTGNPGLSGRGCVATGPASEQFREAGVVGFAGDFNLHLQAPGLGNSGSLDISADLSATSWLRYNWDGAGGDDDPTGRATFGIYRGSSRHIYLRERY